MSGQAYVGTSQRTFAQALLQLLETQYALLGSRRILAVLVEDVQALIEAFYPPTERLSRGWLVFPATRAVGPNPRPGAAEAQPPVVSLAWPLLTSEDIATLAQMPVGAESAATRAAWNQRRLVRLIEHGAAHPDGAALLSLADLALMLNLTTVQVSQYLTAARRSTGRPLLTKGYYFDQGMRPTHKDHIIALYEAGLDEVAIARASQHDQSSVGHYLRDYERVKLLLKERLLPPQIERLLDLKPNVVQAYVRLVAQYHPDVAPATLAPPDP